MSRRAEGSWSSWSGPWCRSLRACLLVGLLAGCGEDAAAIDAAPLPDATPPRGRLSLSWTITLDGAASDCATVGANTVTIIALPRAGGFADVDAVDCEDGTALTHTISAAEYDVTLELVAPEGTLATVDAGRVTIEAGVQTNLDPVTFDVSPTGSVTFRLDAAPDGANCDPVEAPGAGVTEMSLVLRDDGGACVPQTFDVAAGANHPAGSYATDCGGARFTCIETDQELRADGLAAGAYTLEIAAYRGDLSCFGATVPLAVPGGGLVADRGTYRLPIESKDPGCL